MKIGKYIVPHFRLASLLGPLTEIDDTFKGEEGSKQDVAQILKHPEKSGTLGQKISDLKEYGLLAGGRKDKYSVTELGKKVVSLDEAERNEGIQQALGNIELWNVLRRKFGTTIEKERFPVILQRETGAVQADVKKRASFVRNAYVKDMLLLASFGEPTEASEAPDVEATRESTGRKSPMKPQSLSSDKAIVDIEYPGYSGQIEIKDAISLEIVRKIIDAIELFLKSKERTAESQPKIKGENLQAKLTEQSTQ